jgi:hypothetical protein
MWRRLVVPLLCLYATFARAEEPVVAEVFIENRAVVGGLSTLRVTEDSRVDLLWHSDEAVQLHLHGYDIVVEVPAGGSAPMTFTAAVSGRFPVSHHGFGGQSGQDHSHRPLLYLEVLPR